METKWLPTRLGKTLGTLFIDILPEEKEDYGMLKVNHTAQGITGNVLILDCRAQSPCAAIAKVMVAAAQLFPRNAATLPFYFWALLHA